MRVFLGGMSVNGLMLGLNMISGVLAARALSPDGRGALAAVVIAPNLAPLVFSLGSQKMAAYHVARDPDQDSAILLAWSILVAVASVAAVVVLEALLPVLLHAQTAHTKDLARLWMISAIIPLYTQLMGGILLGRHDFRAYYTAVVAQPLIVASAYLVLWAVGALTIGAALVVNLVAGLASLAIAGFSVIRRSRLLWPARGYFLETVWYGLKAQGGDLGLTLNARLDVLIIPSLLGAAQVGYYSVATNVSWIIFAVSATVSSVVLPAAVRRGDGGVETILGSLQFTLVFSVMLGAALAALAPVLVPALYGRAFDASVLPLEVLVAGTVLYSCGSVLLAGLNALNRPWLASCAQMLGAAVTIVGLWVALSRGAGIMGAAVVSFLAYGSIFVTALVLYKHVARIQWAAFSARRQYISALLKPSEPLEQPVVVS